MPVRTTQPSVPTAQCCARQSASMATNTWPGRAPSPSSAGGATAVPLLHPWANRLGRWGYGDVDLRGVALPVDKAGLPLHGNLHGAPFVVQSNSADRLAATTRLRRPARAFPFPHTVTVDARRHADRGLTITTEVRGRLRIVRCRSRSAGTRICGCRTRRAANGSCAGPRANTSRLTNACSPRATAHLSPNNGNQLARDLRRPLRGRSGPDVRDPRTRAALDTRVRRQLSLRAALGAGAATARVDRADDRGDRRARPAARARRRIRRFLCAGFTIAIGR